MPADLLPGIRVAEFGGYVAGPMAGLILADLGAEVIKVEKPAGDDARSVPPFIGGNGFYFVECNRNKKSVVIDLGMAEGLAACRRFLRHVDVILDNFRPGVLTRLGFDHESLRTDNPGLICCSIAGYGDEGPFADWAGYDPVLQAMSGMMMSTGMEGLPPIRVAQSTVDKTGAILAVVALQAALIPRQVTGEGGRVPTRCCPALPSSWGRTFCAICPTARCRGGPARPARPCRATRTRPLITGGCLSRPATRTATGDCVRRWSGWTWPTIRGSPPWRRAASTCRSSPV